MNTPLFTRPEIAVFKDAVKLVNVRGKFMQTAVPVGEGTMAAMLGLDHNIVKEICVKASEKGVVEAANMNCPGQIVISGKVAGVAEATRLCKEAGAKERDRASSERSVPF